jgi:hypothetical protein
LDLEVLMLRQLARRLVKLLIHHLEHILGQRQQVLLAFV